MRFYYPRKMLESVPDFKTGRCGSKTVILQSRKCFIGVGDTPIMSPLRYDQHTPWIPVPTCSLLHAYWTVTSISKLSPKYFVAINIVWFFIRILFKIISYHHSFQKDKHCSWKMDVAFQTSFPCKDFQIDAYSEILSTNQNLCINLKTDLGFV